MAYWITGLGALLWLALRTGTKPSRIAYPCQQTAAITGIGFLGYLASITGLAYLYRRATNKTALVGFGLLAAVLSLTFFISGGAPYAHADVPPLPSWTSGTAVSNVFAVENVPIPPCSLNGGTLPATGDCASQAYALSDEGVDILIDEMENQGDYFYKTAAHPTGITGANDIVVIKINNQWATVGNDRLTTNTDVMKGVIWRILQHPDGFTGEVVVTENTQNKSRSWDSSSSNSEDQAQSYRDVVDVFQSLDYPVYIYTLNDLNNNLVSGGDVGAAGYPAGEYASGDNDDHYILLEDPAGTGTNELSYPKFQTHAGGAYVSMRYGIWDGSSYDADRLTFINMPVLKQHSMAGATISWKNMIGLVTITDNDDTRYGSWNEMHNFYWGYKDGLYDHDTYGLLGRHFAFIGTPDLNVVDAIWIAPNNYTGDGVRQDILLASRDAFAVDWYTSEHVLYPKWGDQDASAARSGTFRNATRVNQNSAAANWSGTYPYMDLLDDYDESTPSPDEHDQMNVYAIDADAGLATTYNLNTATAGTGSGTITNSPVGNSCGTNCNTYDEGTVVTLTAVINTNSTFTGWTGAMNSTTNPITLTMDAAKAVTATFALDTITFPLLVYVGSANGDTVTITPPNSSCSDDCTESYDEGTVVTLTAVINTNSIFTGWTGAMNGTNNPITLTMDAAKEVTAAFALDSNDLFLTIAGNGDGFVNLTPPNRGCTADCSETYDYGEMVTLTAVSSITSTFAGWSGAINSTMNTITLTMDAAKAVAATFTLNRYDLSVDLAGNGDGFVNLTPPNRDCMVDCSETYDHGTMVTLTAVSNTGSTFTGWSGVVNTMDNPITLTMDEAKAMTAAFTLNRYDLSVSVAGDGLVNVNPPNINCTVSCDETYDYGTMVTLTAVSDSGFLFVGWSGAIDTSTNPVTLTIDEAKTVTATFHLITDYMFFPIIMK